MALDHALIEGRRAGTSPDTLRFFTFPPCVLLGRHQCLEAEMNPAFAAAHGIGTARRLTGGGAVFMDPSQLAWEVVTHRALAGAGDLAALTARIAESMAAGLCGLGVGARFRPRNDIEVDGRKLSGIAGFIDGDILILQGTVLVDCDRAALQGVLRLPRGKLDRHGISGVGQRIVTLAELLGTAPDHDHVIAAMSDGLEQGLGLALHPGVLTASEEAAAAHALADEIGRDAFVDSVRPPQGGAHAGAEQVFPGGRLRADLTLERAVLRSATFSGDFIAAPPRVVLDLEAALRGVARAAAPETARRFLAQAGADMLSLRPDDFATVLAQALGQDHGE